MKARWFGFCMRCDGGIAPGDDVVRHRHGWIHAHCASGADDR